MRLARAVTCVDWIVLKALCSTNSGSYDNMMWMERKAAIVLIILCFLVEFIAAKSEQKAVYITEPETDTEHTSSKDKQEQAMPIKTVTRVSVKTQRIPITKIQTYTKPCPGKVTCTVKTQRTKPKPRSKSDIVKPTDWNQSTAPPTVAPIKATSVRATSAETTSTTSSHNASIKPTSAPLSWIRSRPRSRSTTKKPKCPRPSTVYRTKTQTKTISKTVHVRHNLKTVTKTSKHWVTRTFCPSTTLKTSKPHSRTRSIKTSAKKTVVATKWHTLWSTVSTPPPRSTRHVFTTTRCRMVTSTVWVPVAVIRTTSSPASMKHGKTVGLGRHESKTMDTETHTSKRKGASKTASAFLKKTHHKSSTSS